jgi:hypothetical protein
LKSSGVNPEGFDASGCISNRPSGPHPLLRPSVEIAVAHLERLIVQRFGIRPKVDGKTVAESFPSPAVWHKVQAEMHEYIACRSSAMN